MDFLVWRIIPAIKLSAAAILAMQSGLDRSPRTPTAHNHDSRTRVLMHIEKYAKSSLSMECNLIKRTHPQGSMKDLIEIYYL